MATRKTLCCLLLWVALAGCRSDEEPESGGRRVGPGAPSVVAGPEGRGGAHGFPECVGAPASAACHQALWTRPDPRPGLAIRQDRFLRLPLSRSELAAPGDGLPVTVTRRQIIADGLPVVAVRCRTAEGSACGDEDYEREGSTFRIDRSFKEDGDDASLLLVPLRDKLAEMVRAQRQVELELGQERVERLYVTCDQEIPFRMIAALVYTAAMSELRDVHLAVLNPWLPDGPSRLLRVTAPQVSALRSPPGRRSPLHLTLLVREEGFELTADPAHADVRPLLGTIPRTGKAYPYHLLYGRLREIHALRPDETIILVGAAARIPLRIVVQAIDAAQVRLAADRYETLEAYRSAPRHAGEDATTFPRFALVVMD